MNIKSMLKFFFPKTLDSGIAQVVPDKREPVFQDVLRKHYAANGSELHALFIFGLIRHNATKTGRSLNGSVLEIGGYGHPGLALIFLLAGAEKIYINNITPVNNSLPLDYAQNIYSFMQLFLATKKSLTDIVQPVPGTNHVKIRPELLKIFSEQDAAQINIADNSLDFIYSITVLEHIPHPEDVIRNCYRMLKPGGWTFHNIDMRDHRDFNKPLEFLRLSEEEFCSTDEASNRMRISDYNYVFEKCGFEISMIEYYNRIEVVDSQSTDCFSTLLNPYSNLIKDRLDLIDIWVNDSMKNMFHPDFQKYSLNELSCVVANITGWK